jgi:hypothetical protein
MVTSKVLTRRRCSKCGGWDYYEDDHGWQTHCINCGHISLLEKPVGFRRGVTYEAERTREPQITLRSHRHPSLEVNPAWENCIQAMEF